MAVSERVDQCYVCRKHRGNEPLPGGPVYEDELIFAGHGAIPEGEETVYQGLLFIEPKRHVPSMAELNDAEAQRIGLVAARLSRALKQSEGAEHVYLFTIGHQVPHLHVGVVPRYPETPREYWGMRVDEWPEAPMADVEQVAALVARLRAYLELPATYA